MNITKTGYWVIEDKNVYTFDKNLCILISGFLEKHKYKKVYDFGCGSGDYVKNLNLMGFNCLGIDGNPYVGKFIQPSIIRDFTEPFLLKRWDSIICIDVAELIHPNYEDIFLDNLCNNADKSILLSWHSTKTEDIQINCRDINHIIEQFTKRGYKLNATDTYGLKNALKKEIYVFNRVYNSDFLPTKDLNQL